MHDYDWNANVISGGDGFFNIHKLLEWKGIMTYSWATTKIRCIVFVVKVENVNSQNK